VSANTGSRLKPKTVILGDVPISRLLVGGNPFSGFSHQNLARDTAMLDWYTMERIKETFRLAEAAGVTTHLGRGDHFIMRALREHWHEGGGLTWVCQTCPEVGSIDRGVGNAVHGGAVACFIHGGEMDYRVANDDTAAVRDGIQRIKDEGLAAGVAGHTTRTIRWAADHLDLDFFMTCYYDPEDRSGDPMGPGGEEQFREEDREAMCALIQELPKPAIHFKVLAAGRTDPKEAFAYVADAYRPGDAVCVGVFTEDDADMIQRDVDLLETALRDRGK